MILRLLAVIGAGAIVVFVLLTVSTFYVVDGEDHGRTAASSPAVDMRDQLRKAATPAPAKRATDPAVRPAVAAPAIVAPAPAAPAAVAAPAAPSAPPSMDTPVQAYAAEPPSPAADAFDGATGPGGDDTGALGAAPTPAPAARAVGAPDKVADQTASEPEKRRPRKGAARCETYRTYNAETKTYRGFDGKIKSCP